MTTAENFNRAALAQPGAMEAHTRGRFGMDAKTLEGHLQLMSQIAAGRVTKQARQWLYDRAKESGVPRQRVDAELNAVLALPTPADRQARYVAASGGDQSMVAHAMELAKRYDLNRASIAVEDRLAQSDRSREQWRSSSYGFEDRPEFEHDRHEAQHGVRASLEKAMVSSGLAAPKPRTLEEAQSRAQGYALSVADRLERRLHSGEPGTLRDAVEDAYLASDAMAAKADAGLSDDTTGSVMEQTNVQRSYSESLTEAP